MSGTVKVKVRLYAGLARYLPGAASGQSLEIEVPPEATVGAMLDRLGIPRAEMKLCDVGGRHRETDHVLRDGDEVALFPPVGGGSAGTLR